VPLQKIRLHLDISTRVTGVVATVGDLVVVVGYLALPVLDPLCRMSYIYGLIEPLELRFDEVHIELPPPMKSRKGHGTLYAFTIFCAWCFSRKSPKIEFHKASDVRKSLGIGKTNVSDIKSLVQSKLSKLYPEIEEKAFVYGKVCYTNPKSKRLNAAEVRGDVFDALAIAKHVNEAIKFF